MLDDHIVFKIIVLGQSGVGKTSMLFRYIKGQFSENYNVTVGMEFASKNVSINQTEQVKLQIWDTAGQQTFRALVRSFYKGIAAVFLCFAIDNQETLYALKNWVKQVKQNGHQEIVFILIGTKCDLQPNKKVIAEKANQLLKQIGAYFYIETSAKQNTNVNTLFSKAAEIMHKKFISNESFRNLVQPSRVTGMNFQPRISFSLNQRRQTTPIQNNNSCCN